MYAGIETEIRKRKYNKEDEERILELIKAFNIGGRGGATDIVNCAFSQYDLFKQKIKEANENA